MVITIIILFGKKIDAMYMRSYSEVGFDVDGAKVLFVEGAMRRQLFPLHLGELFGELMTVLLYDKLMDFLKSGKGGAEASEVSARLGELKQRYRPASCFTGPTCVNFAMPSASDWWKAPYRS